MKRIRWPSWPQCLQEGWKPGCWILTRRQRTRSRNGRFLTMRKLTNRIKTDSSHTVTDKRERKEINMIWNNHFNSELLTSERTSVQDAEGQASAEWQRGPVYDPFQSWVHQQEEAEDRASNARTPRVAGPWLPEGMWEALGPGPRTSPLPSLPSFTCLCSFKSSRVTCCVNAGLSTVCLASGQDTVPKHLCHFLSPCLTRSSPG